MAGKDDNKRPIIIRRKKVIAGGHHGGAWKVAYADFVTAMMAFFMLMWLLNATTEKQRKGLADYFAPTIAISRSTGGGDGALGGQSSAASAAEVQIGRGGVTASELHGTSQDEAEMEAVEAAVLGRGGESLLDEEQLRHVALRLTDEGLVIEFFELPGSPLFEGDGLGPAMIGLIAAIAPELRRRPNALAIEGYTAAEPVVTRSPSGWSRSAARADALRRALPGAGISDARVVRVTGHADRRPATDDPTSPRNDRLEIVMLRGAVPPRR